MSEVPVYVRDHILARPWQKAQVAAAALGLTRASILTYRSRLRREGHAIPLLRDNRHDPDALIEAVDLLDGGWSALRVAQRLRCSRKALRHRLYRADLTVTDARAAGVLRAPAILALFGYAPGSRGKVTARLQAAGLVMRRAGRGRSAWLVTQGDLMDWLATPAAWAIVTPDRITDPDWRSYAAEVRHANL